MRLLPLMLFLPACQLFKDLQEDIEGVLDPTVVVGAFTKLDPPESDLVDLESLDLSPGVAGTLFLADARNVDELSSAPITGATLEVAGCGEVVVMDEDASGTYTLLPGTPLDACEGDLVVTRTDSERATIIPIAFPARPTWTLPSQWRAGDADVVVPVTDSEFNSVLGVVMDGSNGDVTWSNEPEGVREYYEFLTGTGDVVDITLGEAELREDTVMAVLLTGLVKLKNADLTEVNTALSVVDAGRTRLYPIATTPQEL